MKYGKKDKNENRQGTGKDLELIWRWEQSHDFQTVLYIYIQSHDQECWSYICINIYMIQIFILLCLNTNENFELNPIIK